MANKQALVDSGATNNFIHPNFVKRLGLQMTLLERPKWIYDIDNTSNRAGSITHSLELKVTTKNQDKVMLLGHDDGFLHDKNIKVTVMYSHFGPKCNQRMVRNWSSTFNVF